MNNKTDITNDLINDDYQNSSSLIKKSVLRLAKKTSIPVAELVKIYFPK